jgi:hypothetical protein
MFVSDFSKESYISGLVKRNETEETEKKNLKRNGTKRNGTERKENDKIMKRNGTKRNSCETERNFCEAIKTKRKENRITFLIHFKFRDRFFNTFINLAVIKRHHLSTTLKSRDI